MTTTTSPHQYLYGEARKDAATAAAKLYRDGMSIRAIASATGRSYGAVHRLLVNDAGVELRPRGGSTRRKPTK